MRGRCEGYATRAKSKRVESGIGGHFPAICFPRAGQLDGRIGSAPISGSPSRVDQVSRTSNVELLQRVHNVPLFHDLIDK